MQPVKYIMIKVTIIDEDTNLNTTLEFEHIEYSQQFGIKLEPNVEKDTTDVQHNGHEKMIIKLWSGFEEWDDFKTDTKETLGGIKTNLKGYERKLEDKEETNEST